VPLDPTRLSSDVLSFLRERHLATLTTQRSDLSPHVVAVGFTYDPDAQLVRVITGDGSIKVRNAERRRPDGSAGRAVVCQVDGRRWLALEGTAAVDRERSAITDAEQRYALRYRTPRVNPHRVVLTISVDRILGHA
jgi:PPOX class probable F420-dependent enzyme